MGSQLFLEGKFQEAETYYREAMEKSRHALGAEHDITLKAIINVSTASSLRESSAKLNSTAGKTEQERPQSQRRSSRHATRPAQSGYPPQRQNKLADAERYCREGGGDVRARSR